ncbi:MFS transporter [Streptomyces sp. AJS327]|uniref:MFS transporter n=1 Tax=Streptomyces sp. AJS327 TaxID=2545265 RepID=UPI0015DD65A8|nr:MFS transporter [Streptomyces sp. AJS327]MBA0053575.1 MFS transporter [Streptomyces sp. AJS327]
MTTVDAARDTTRRPRGTLALLGGVQVALIFTLASIAVPLPLIERELGLRHAEMMLLSTAYGLTFAGLLLFGGRLADRYGGRRVLTVGLALFAAASALAPLATGIGGLLAARLAQGAGAALVAPAAMAVVRAAHPDPAAYRRAMATWGGLSVLGATAGNLLSGPISTLLSWRWTFAPPLLVALAALVLAPRLLPDTVPRPDRRLDVLGALLATAGITLVSYGFVATSARPWLSAGVLGPLLGGAVLLAAFRHVERQAPDPLLPLHFPCERRRLLALSAIALSACATSMTFVLVSLHLQRDSGWSPLATSAAFLPFALTLFAGGRAAGALIVRYGARAVTSAGLGSGAVGLVLLALTGVDARISYAPGLLPGLLLLSAGTAASFAGGAVLATDGVPPRSTGLAGGVLNTAMEVGPTVLFAALLTLGGDARPLAATGAALGVLALLFHRNR